MKNYKQKLKRGVIRVGQCGLIFGAAAMVMGYLLGYYDLSFIDRADLLGVDYQPSAVSVGEENPSSGGMPAIPENSVSEGDGAEHEDYSPQGGLGDGLGGSDGVDAADSDAVSAPTDLKRVYDVARLPDEVGEVPLCSELLGEGMAYAEEFGEGAALGRMVFSFKLPEEAHYSRRIYQRQLIITPNDDGEPYLYLKDTAEYRPAVELYMGYILIDSGDDVIIVSGDGVPLSRFAYDRYAAAYARDDEGKPLFSRKTDGGEVRYFVLSDNGKKFVQSDYDPDLDFAGLSFDYPAGWFDSDSTAVSVVSNMPAVDEKDEKDGGGSKADAGSKADSKADSGKTDKPKKPEKLLFGYATPTGRLTEVKFAHAYPFRENRGVAVADGGRGELKILNQDGREAFPTSETYMNEHGRYETVYYMPPLATGLESAGHLYYENGLLRVRKQVIDYYNYVVRRKVTVADERDVLLRLDGSEYPIPAGFTLAGYSEGRIVLKGAGNSGKYGVMSVEGSWVVQPIFASVTPYVGGLSVIGCASEDGGMRYGLVGRDGEIVLPFTYDRIQVSSGGLVCVYREENGWSVFKAMK